MKKISKKVRLMGFIGLGLLSISTTVPFVVSCSDGDAGGNETTPPITNPIPPTTSSKKIKAVRLNTSKNINSFNVGDKLESIVQLDFINGFNENNVDFIINYELKKSNGNWETKSTNKEKSYVYCEQLDRSFDKSSIRVSVQEKGFQELTYSNVISININENKNTTIKNEYKLLGANLFGIKDLDNNFIKNNLINKINDIFIDLPTNINKDHIKFNIKEKIYERGEIRLEIILPSYIENNNLINKEKAFEILLVGFKVVDYSTKIVNKNYLDVNGILSNTSPSDITNNDETLKDFISRNIIENKVENNINNTIIESYEISEQSNVNGSLLLTKVNIRNYYDKNANIVNELKTFDTNITLKGFKTTKPTMLNTNEIDLYYDDLTTDEATEDYLKNQIWYNFLYIFSNLPSSFNQENITKVTINERFSFEGKLKITIELNSYYDENGIYINDDSKPLKLDLIVTGFKSVDKSTKIIEPTIQYSDHEKLASDVDNTDPELKQIILDNMIQNKPIDFNIENIVSFDIVEYDNFNGQVSINNIVVNKYYDQNGNEINSNKVFNESIFKIKGFKQIDVTYVEEVITISEFNPLSQKNTNQVNNNELIEYIFENKVSLIHNQAPDFKKDDINILINSTIPYDGIIDVTIRLSNYINQLGQHINDINNQYEKNIKIQGFKSVDLSTKIEYNKKNVDGDLAQILPSNLDTNNDSFKEFVRNNFFINLPSTFTSDNIVQISISNINDLKGELTISSIKVNQYLDENQKLVNQEKTFDGEWIVSGFLKNDTPSVLFINNDKLDLIQKKLNDIFEANKDNFTKLDNAIRTDFKDYFDSLFINEYDSYSKFIDFDFINYHNSLFTIPFKDITLISNDYVQSDSYNYISNNNIYINLNYSSPSDQAITIDQNKINEAQQKIAEDIRGISNKYAINTYLYNNMNDIFNILGLDINIWNKYKDIRIYYYDNSYFQIEIPLLSHVKISDEYPDNYLELKVQNHIENFKENDFFITKDNKIFDQLQIKLFEIVKVSNSINDFNKNVNKHKQEFLELLDIHNENEDFNNFHFSVSIYQSYDEKSLAKFRINLHSKSNNSNTYIGFESELMIKDVYEYLKQSFIKINFTDDVYDQLYKLFDLDNTKQWINDDVDVSINNFKDFINSKENDALNIIKNNIENQQQRDLLNIDISLLDSNNCNQYIDLQTHLNNAHNLIFWENVESKKFINGTALGYFNITKYRITITDQMIREINNIVGELKTTAKNLYDFSNLYNNVLHRLVEYFNSKLVNQDWKIIDLNFESGNIFADGYTLNNINFVIEYNEYGRTERSLYFENECSDENFYIDNSYGLILKSKPTNRSNQIIDNWWYLENFVSKLKREANNDFITFQKLFYSNIENFKNNISLMFNGLENLIMNDLSSGLSKNSIDIILTKDTEGGVVLGKYSLIAIGLTNLDNNNLQKIEYDDRLLNNANFKYYEKIDNDYMIPFMFLDCDYGPFFAIYYLTEFN